MTTTSPTDTPVQAESNIASLKAVLTDPEHDRSTNLLRLQGWRGDDLEASVGAASIAHRLGPAACGILSLAAAVTGSMAIVLITLATALVGVFARNHPFETIYNVVARRTGRQPLPANRAAKRLGCAVGSVFLAGAAVAWIIGFDTLATVLLVSLGSLALFVAATKICVPSMMFTLAFGVDRATACRLISLDA